jgi:predicted nucleic acid-binding protein
LTVVLDSSAVVAALVDSGPHGIWAEEILARGPPYAPELVMVEAMNILRRLERAHEITGAEANAGSDDLLELEIELLPFQPFSGRVWQLRHTLTSYDAWYVAAAETLGLPLATLDRRLSRARGPKCKFVMP